MDKRFKFTTNIIVIPTLIVFVLYSSNDIKTKRIEDSNTKVQDAINLSINKAILSVASTSYIDKIVSLSDMDTVEKLSMKKESVEIRKEELQIEKETEEALKVKTPPDKKQIAESINRDSDLCDSKTKPDTNLSQSLNQYVLDVINTYKIGSYPYLLNNDYENYNGVTENLYYQGEVLLKGDANGTKASNCTGITFEVFFRAMQKRNKSLGLDPEDFNGMSRDQLFDMALNWFAAMGHKSQSNIAVAVEKYNLGYRINNFEDLRAGDFIDLSRENNTGHTVVFLNWIREDKKIIGFKYWSSQGSTNGISNKEEYFNIYDVNGNKYGNVIIDNLYMVRISPK